MIGRASISSSVVLGARKGLATRMFSTRGGGGGIPSVLSDGNTVAWYDYQESVTKDASDRVSVWGDKSGLSHDLLQATGASQPLYTTDGILFDGVSEYLKAAAFTLVQPEFIYMVINQASWILGRYLFDGNTVDSGQVVQRQTASPNIRAYAGNVFGETSNLAVNSYGILRVLFNGASSKLQVNETTAITANGGTLNMGGFALAINGNGTNPSNIEVKEIIIRKVADATADEQAIYDYLASKYSIS